MHKKSPNKKNIKLNTQQNQIKKPENNPRLLLSKKLDFLNNLKPNNLLWSIFHATTNQPNCVLTTMPPFNNKILLSYI